MTVERLFHDASLGPRLEAELATLRTKGGELDVRAGLAWLHSPGGSLHISTPQTVSNVARVIATVAWVDLGLAFSLWGHRMVLEYARLADQPLPLPQQRALDRAELLGSTALASGVLHYLTGAPLPIVARRVSSGLVLDGRVSWASNLFDEAFLLVTAVNLEREGPRIVAVPAASPGLSIDPYPLLHELQATRSSSLRVTALELPQSSVLAVDFDDFVGRVRQLFLPLQAAFCWGLAARSLHEASLALHGLNEIFAPEHSALAAGLDRLELELGTALADLDSKDDSSGAWNAEELAPRRQVRDLVRLRLEAARLAGAATRLESKVMGGAGFVATSGTARRLREAAFLPIQAPTEGLLLWELSRSN